MRLITEPIVLCQRAAELDLLVTGARAAAHFAAHETVKHSAGEYVRDDVHTNSAEGYFSIFKRGMSGIYQHCAEKHLHRYLAEYDFRYNHRVRLGFNDGERAALAVKNATGKRRTGIIVWLEVRVLPGPPRTPAKTEIS
jgi:hypothetical protein